MSDIEVSTELGDGNIVKNTAPIWQMPGVGWELVPFVPYDSFTEYRTLVDEVSDAYSSMVRRGIETGNLQLWSVSCYGLSRGVKRYWMDHGKDIFLRLTKGIGKDWCELVNMFLVNTLDTAARVFVYTGVQFPVTGFVDTQESRHEIFDILERELRLFIHDWHINPMERYSFYYANFTFYRNTSSCTEDIENHYLPINKFQDIMAAFAMGMHDRLGENNTCVIRMLDNDLLRYIFTFGVF
jgi:hypothetical protein